MKKFNTTGPCIPKKHYMVDMSKQLDDIRRLVLEGAYFTVNRARQYGKTTLLAALARLLEQECIVVSLDFQKFSESCFEEENSFCRAFAAEFYEEAKHAVADTYLKKLDDLEKDIHLDLRILFRRLMGFCAESQKPVVLIIDEADSATNNQVFLDFLAQLRSGYLDRELKHREAFQSVILAGVYDVRNMKRKIRPNEEHRVNSPWNIAADFDVDLSFTIDGIAQMLLSYEKDYATGMDRLKMAGYLYDYTSGYPFLVSRLCLLMDEKVSRMEGITSKKEAWTPAGFQEAVRMILAEKSPLFDSMTGKLEEYRDLDKMLRTLLFTGKNIAYNPDDEAVGMAVMFGFVKVQEGYAVIANRIFETRLYNRYLAAGEVQSTGIYKAALLDKNKLFIQNGHLNMERVLERFVQHFEDLYGDRDEAFYEDII